MTNKFYYGNNIKGLLFDVDGVLVDSEKYIQQAYFDYYKEKYNLDLTLDDLGNFVGTGEITSIVGLGKKFNLKYDIREDKKGIYNTYSKLIKGKLKLMPGVERFIFNAKKAGLKLALATSADRVKLNYSFSETGLDLSLFDFIVSGDIVIKTKPDGGIYKYAAAGLVLSNEECLVIEDALSGHEAAKNAGSLSLGVTSSFDVNSQILSGADLVIKDLSFFPVFSTMEEFNDIFNEMTNSFRENNILGDLFDKARSVINNSYSPYSKFKVGAALLTDDGNIYSGCNVENASFGGSICAERSAMLAAISTQGKTKVRILVVSSYSEEPAPPCAICRQFFTEFSDSNMQVYLISLSGKRLRHYNFGSIMPYVFEL